MVTVHYPPLTPTINKGSLKVFLAGTIDMGNSEDWQQIVIDYLNLHFDGCPLELFNPRRKDWNKDWEQSPSHPMLKRQIEWELDYLEQADCVLMVLLGGSQSPVSMLELGAFSGKIINNGGIIVFNPDNFYRYANIEIFCRKFSIPTLHEWDDYLIAIRRAITHQLNRKLALNE